MINATTATTLPRLAVTLGDASGIGPEVAVKLLADPANRSAAQLILIADPVALREGEAAAGMKLANLFPINDWNDPVPADRIGLLTRDWLGGAPATRGQVDVRSGVFAPSDPLVWRLLTVS